MSAPTLIYGAEGPGERPIASEQPEEHRESEELRDAPPHVPVSPAVLQGGSCDISRSPTMPLCGGDFLREILKDQQLLPVVNFPSIMDEKVLNPEPPLPGWNSPTEALSLKQCLQPFFEEGLDPEESMSELIPTTVTWLQQLSQTSTTSVSWSPAFESALGSYKTMYDSTVGFQSKLETSMCTLNSIHQAVCDRYDGMLHGSLTTQGGKLDVELRKNALVKWALQRRTAVQKGLEEVEARHTEIRNMFDGQIRHMIKAAYSEFRADLDNVDEEKMFSELDGVINWTSDPEFTPGSVPPPGIGQVPEVLPTAMPTHVAIKEEPELSQNDKATPFLWG